jgi:hypothetical protein
MILVSSTARPVFARSVPRLSVLPSTARPVFARSVHDDPSSRANAARYRMLEAIFACGAMNDSSAHDTLSLDVHAFHESSKFVPWHGAAKIKFAVQKTKINSTNV